ncbi:MAG: hypothetical protein R2911_34290 [Caldilineaceae bacterium]
MPNPPFALAMEHHHAWAICACVVVVERQLIGQRSRAIERIVIYNEQL